MSERERQELSCDRHSLARRHYYFTTLLETQTSDPHRQTHIHALIASPPTYMHYLRHT